MLLKSKCLFIHEAYTHTIVFILPGHDRRIGMYAPTHRLPASVKPASHESVVQMVFARIVSMVQAVQWGGHSCKYKSTVSCVAFIHT